MRRSPDRKRAPTVSTSPHFRPNGRNQQRATRRRCSPSSARSARSSTAWRTRPSAHLYNCVENDAVAARTGFTKLGVEKIGGLSRAGVMLEHRGDERRGHTRSPTRSPSPTFEEAMKRERVDFGAGDHRAHCAPAGAALRRQQRALHERRAGDRHRRRRMAGEEDIMMSDRTTGPSSQAVSGQGLFCRCTGSCWWSWIFLLENLDLEAFARDKVTSSRLSCSPSSSKAPPARPFAPMAVR